MRRIVLFIAMSLDGYIADFNGGVDWLEGEHPGEDDMVSYQTFIQNIDTVLMGWNTYHQLVTELSPDQWMYSDFTSYIITHHPEPSMEAIRFTDENPVRLVTRLKEEPGKDIWICGGASIARQLMETDLIDRYHISVIPTILGGGTPLFGALTQALTLRLIQTKSYNGITDLVYERRLPLD